MKKIIVLLVSIILITGCGNAKKEKVVCTKSSTNMGVTSDLTVKYELYKHQINKLDFTLNVKVDDNLKSALLNELNSKKEEYYNDYGINSSIEETSTGYKLAFKLNAKESSDFYTKVYNKSSKDVVYTVKSIKENGESLGFACKEE